MPITTRWRGTSWLFVVGVIVALAGCGAPKLVSEVPKIPFDRTVPPPPPDYSEGSAWLAWPGRNGLERSVPPGERAVEEAKAPADVFFIHPTTYLKDDRWNVPIEAPTELGAAVLLNQASAFNGCCRIYAPRYRQATLAGLGNDGAVDLAYGDIRRAFLYYLAHENHGRPFILASHSQGTLHLVRLLQDEIIGTPLQKRMVAAYAIGAYVPDTLAKLGLPICEAAQQTGCVLSWNTNERGLLGMVKLTGHPRYWWQGAYITPKTPPAAVCVNPLTWTSKGAAPASDNLGGETLPKPMPAETAHAVTLPEPQRAVTGAQCRDTVLRVDVSWFNLAFQDKLSLLYGSFHLMDYGLFYQNIRQNAILRVAAFENRQGTQGGGAPGTH